MDHWYQWFSNGFLEFWRNGQRWFWPRKNLKLHENCDISYFATTVRIILELENIKCFISQFLTMYPCQFQSYRVFLVLWAHSFATIAELQWFSKVPSPLNGMVGGNHWDQWFSDGFGVRQPLVTMVFDGCAPLVRRWNGYVPSSKSKTSTCRHLIPTKMP